MWIYSTYGACLHCFIDQTIAKDKNSSLVDDDKSPPISARLRELTNSMRALCSATPFSLKTAENDDSSLVSSNILEPKTPVVEHGTMTADRWNVKNVNSPWETFSTRNSGMKVWQWPHHSIHPNNSMNLSLILFCCCRTLLSKIIWGF